MVLKNDNYRQGWAKNTNCSDAKSHPQLASINSVEKPVEKPRVEGHETQALTIFNH